METIKIEKEILNCYECPYKKYYTEQGFSGNICSLQAYLKCEENCIPKYCPLRKR